MSPGQREGAGGSDSIVVSIRLMYYQSGPGTRPAGIGGLADCLP
jgi:hypothetical protein